MNGLRECVCERREGGADGLKTLARHADEQQQNGVAFARHAKKIRGSIARRRVRRRPRSPSPTVPRQVPGSSTVEPLLKYKAQILPCRRVWRRWAEVVAGKPVHRHTSFC